MQLHPNLPSLPIFQSNFSMLLDQTQHCLEKNIRFSGDATFRVLLSGLQQLWDECQEVWVSTPCHCLQRFCLGIQLLLKLLSGNSAAAQAFVWDFSCSIFWLGIQLLLKLHNSSHREMVVQRIWQRRVKRQRAKKERIKKREEQDGCLVDEPG